jgi:hypothetical protein
MIKILPAALAVCLLFSLAPAQTSRNTESEAKRVAGRGVVYKVPDGVMPLPSWSGFKGMMMLCGKKPCGLFISYPNEGESLEALKKRMSEWIGSMFLHDDAKAKAIVWQSKDIPAHKGDKGNKAKMITYDDPAQTLQIDFFEREYSGLSFVYGYFGRKSKTSGDKDNSSDILDESGNGAKLFDKFWKTLPE